MWPQQQAQYSNNMFNNGNVPLQPAVQPIQFNLPNEAQQQSSEKILDLSFKRQTEGPVLWFAGPPLNVMPEKKPLHSVTYLDWKKTQQQQQ